MNGRSVKSLRIVFALLILSYSCYKETILVPVHNKGVFNFIMDSIQEQMIYNARGIQFEVVDPMPTLEYTSSHFELKKLEIRGETTLDFRRKGYTVKLETPLELYITEDLSSKKFKEFKLLALVFDYTYFEYYTATNLFKEVGLWPMYSFLTEVQINKHTQGIYLFIEDPAEYFFKFQDAAVVIRRGYLHTQDSFKANPAISSDTANLLSSQFNKIYADIVKYSGKQLYDTLSSYVDLENYFTKISIDMLIQNGDYDDEIFFYAIKVDGKYYFRVIPWDLDDLFMDNPHEIGRSWAMSNLFGIRIYNSMDDIYKDVGHKLIFSIEDDLDYIIAKDEYLYTQYLITLEKVIDKYDDQTIDRIVDKTEESLLPFYENDSIIAQSRYDVDATSYELFRANLTQKRQMLKDRKNWIINELNKLK